MQAKGRSGPCTAGQYFFRRAAGAAYAQEIKVGTNSRIMRRAVWEIIHDLMARGHEFEAAEVRETAERGGGAWGSGKGQHGERPGWRSRGRPGARARSTSFTKAS